MVAPFLLPVFLTGDPVPVREEGFFVVPREGTRNEAQ